MVKPVAVKTPTFLTAGRKYVGNIAVASLLVFAVYMLATGRPGGLGQAVQSMLGESLLLIVSIQFLVVIPAIFLLEHFFPANPEQRIMSPSVLLDAFFMLAIFPVARALAAVLTLPAADWLRDTANVPVLDSTRSWPLWLAALAGLTIADFGSWFAHVIKHRVPLFWRFHIVHHSQADLNVFTTNKLHPIDYIIEHFILFLPFFFFFPSFLEQQQAVLVISLVAGWFTRLQHANIRTNLGPLRYFLVTPQSHRVHHSLDPVHYNANYASILTWDRLFGFQHPDSTSYPPTGISDTNFPEPKSYSPVDLLTSLTGQLLYPFNRDRILLASDPLLASASAATPQSSLEAEEEPVAVDN